ncbi:hypothetical protein Anas_00406, partial [Armadillidium nasatum]
MKLKLCFVVVVLGLLTVTEGRFPKFSLKTNERILDPEEAAEINSKAEDEINEKWRKIHLPFTQPPVDLGKYWDDDIFNATHIGLKCPQGGYGNLQPGGDEDCLFLNVYTPYKPGTIEARNLTVMFFIYGGGFTFGGSATYMPTKLLNHDVILVTMHYRLGAFGFYTRDSPSAPGNLAFYDMISALRW